jgi:multidrug efflux pump subunit AcrA (membrane-fusion protein)
MFGGFNIYKNSGLEVTASHARTGKVVETIDAAGEISAENSANLSFQTAGVVTEVNFKEGDFVQKNTSNCKT